jgi:hypothetical protein
VNKRQNLRIHGMEGGAEMKYTVKAQETYSMKA